MSTRSFACSWARSNKPCQAVKASIGTDAASTWVSRAGLGVIADGGAQQNSAVAPWAYQSFMPNTSWPTMPSAPTPTAAMAPENSWPGMAWRRFSTAFGGVGRLPQQFGAGHTHRMDPDQDLASLGPRRLDLRLHQPRHGPGIVALPNLHIAPRRQGRSLLRPTGHGHD